MSFIGIELRLYFSLKYEQKTEFLVFLKVGLVLKWTVCVFLSQGRSLGLIFWLIIHGKMDICDCESHCNRQEAWFCEIFQPRLGFHLRNWAKISAWAENSHAIRP